MLSRLARTLLRLAGWTVEGPMPPVTHSVMVAAPHTSNWDVPIMLAAAMALRVRVSLFVKHTAFWWPLGPLLRSLGAVPLNRAAPHAMVRDAVAAFRAAPSLHLALAPEGTRRRTSGWKKGFYYIAVQAQVPIVMAFVDYRRRAVGLRGYLMPSGDIAADMEKIRQAYADVTARFPELASPVALGHKEPS